MRENPVYGLKVIEVRVVTGPAQGKIRIPVEVIIMGHKVDSIVYIHLKGYSRARITHIDIEGFDAEGDKINGGMAVGTSNGLTIILKKEIVIAGKNAKKIVLRGLRVLNIGERAKCVIGIKDGGIFVGFESKVLPRLEKFALERIDEASEG